MQALDRLAKLRAAMENLGIDAVIIPTADPHLSEYVPAHWSLRATLWLHRKCRHAARIGRGCCTDC